jgi:magnesium transporter
LRGVQTVPQRQRLIFSLGSNIMINTLYLPELREMIAETNTADLQEFCDALHPARTAEFMEGLTSREAWTVLQHAAMPLRVEIFSYFSEEKQSKMLATQNRQEVAELVAEIAADDRVDMLQLVDDNVVDELLQLLPTEERRDILRLRAFPEGTAGAVMTTDVATLDENLLAKDALMELGRQAEDVETIYYLYVVDDNMHLRGVVSARQLVSAMGKPEARLRDLMETDLTVVDVMDDQEEVVDKVAHYDLLAIPVVDAERRMLGIITHDDIIDVVREEATEDAHLSAAVTPLEETYLKTPILILSRKRGIWLVILFIGGLLTALALQHYEDVLDRFKWLSLFIPLIISSGGNSGNQSATLIITAMTTGDVKISDWLRVVLRELAMGFVLGGSLAALGCIAAFVIAPEATFIVPCTLLLVVLSGTLCGATLPIFFKRLGLDPAMMSNPFVAGIVDVLGIVIYVKVAVNMQGMFGF